MSERPDGFLMWADVSARLGRAFSVPYVARSKCSVEVHFPQMVKGFLFFRPSTIVARLDSGADVCVFSRTDLANVGVSLTPDEEDDVERRGAVWLADNCGVAGRYIVRNFHVGSCRFCDVDVFVPMAGVDAFYELCRQKGGVPRKGEVVFSAGEIRRSVIGIRGILDKAVVCLDQHCVHFFGRAEVADSGPRSDLNGTPDE